MIILFITGVLIFIALITYFVIAGKTGTSEEKVAQMQDEARNAVYQDQI